MTVLGTAPNTVTIKVHTRDGLVPDWHREPRWNRRPIAYSNREDLQFGGLGNWQLSFTAVMNSAEEYARILSWVGDTPRVLSDWFGTTYPDVYVYSVGQPRRSVDPDEPLFFVDITLEREGS